jgi:hypothetical protein
MWRPRALIEHAILNKPVRPCHSQVDVLVSEIPDDHRIRHPVGQLQFIRGQRMPRKVRTPESHDGEDEEFSVVVCFRGIFSSPRSPTSFPRCASAVVVTPH